jgi:DNA replication protein DnaC
VVDLEEQCPLCRGRGLLVRGDTAVPCACAGRGRGPGSLPPRLALCTLDRFSLGYYARDRKDPDRGTSYYELARVARTAAEQFIQDFPGRSRVDGLLFTGGVGSGKTFLAGAVANALLAGGARVSFIVVPDLLDMLRASYDAPRDQGWAAQGLWDAARETPLLILDDLGAHNYTEWTLNRLYSLVNYRFNHLLPLVVTTNISLEDMQGYLGERTTSRLIQMCRIYRLLVETDIRLLVGTQAARS